MQRKINRLWGGGLLAATIAVASHLCAAEPTETTTPKPPGVSETRASADDTSGVKKTARANRYPIRGRLKAIDVNTRKLTLSGSGQNRVFATDTETTFTRNGKPAKLEDGVPGEDVGGLAEKQPDGTVLAVKVRFGPKPPEPDATTGSSRKRGGRASGDNAMNP